MPQAVIAGPPRSAECAVRSPNSFFNQAGAFENKKCVTFAALLPEPARNLQVGKRDNLNKRRGDSHSRDTLPVGSESHDNLGHITVHQCVSDFQFSGVPAGLQSAHQRVAVRRPELSAKRLHHAVVLALGAGQQSLCAGDPADRTVFKRWRPCRCAKGAGGAATTDADAWPSPSSWWSASASDASNTSGNANAADPDNDGDTSNNETVINIQITVSSGADNKVDIQA